MSTPTPTPRCWAEISTQAFEDNYRFFDSLIRATNAEAELLAVVKANAYGHSLALCAPAAMRAGAHWLGVTCVEEAIAARALCPGARVLVMSGCLPGEGPAVIENGLTPVVWELAHLDELESAARRADRPPASVPVHLEIDTGMSRQGASLDELPALATRLANPSSPLRCEAIMTHLYAADESDGRATDAQLARLEDALHAMRSGIGRQTEWLNVGASATLFTDGAARISELARRHGMKPMIRPGLSLYGIVPEFEPAFAADTEPETIAAARTRLKPVLAWKTRIVSVRNIAAGSVVGYNGTFVATEPMRLALLPIGYADGLDRRLGNRFSLLVGGERAPLVGRISMDHAVIDVTEIPAAAPGDEVVILGLQGSATISAIDHAKASGTIPWEVFTGIAHRVHRIEV